MPDAEIPFKDGGRKNALLQAIATVKETGRSAQLIVCRDIPGDHEGGADCFCGPWVLYIDSKDKKD